MGATGVGAVLVSLGIASRGRLRSQGRLMMLSYLAWGVALALFALSRWFSLSLALDGLAFVALVALIGLAYPRLWRLG